MTDARRTPSRLRTIGAIARRDWRMQRSYQFQLFMRVVQTVFVVASLSITSKLVTDAPSLAQYEGNYFAFALIGITMLAFLGAGLRTFGGRLAEEQSLGTLEVVLASPVDLATFLLGSLVVPFGMALVNVVAFLVVGIGLFGARFPITGLLLAVPIALLTLAVFSSIGILSASFILLTKRGDPITAVVAQFSTFLGGAFFPVDLLPSGLRWAAHLFPSYWSLQGLRAVLIGQGAGSAVTPILVLVGFTVVLLPASLWCFRWTVRTCMRLGTLGTY